MELLFIIILIIVGAFAIWFNIWNYRNPVGSRNKKTKDQPTKLHIDKSYQQTERPLTADETEQTERILKMFKDKEDLKK